MTVTKRGKAVRAEGALARDGHVARGLPFAVVVAADRVLVVVQPAEARVVAPGLLHEFELAADAGVDAEEMDPARPAIIHEREDGGTAGGGRRV